MLISGPQILTSSRSHHDRDRVTPPEVWPAWPLGQCCFKTSCVIKGENSHTYPFPPSFHLDYNKNLQMEIKTSRYVASKWLCRDFFVMATCFSFNHSTVSHCRPTTCGMSRWRCPDDEPGNTACSYRTPSDRDTF